MRRVRIDRARPGAILAAPLRSPEGQVVLREGSPLQEAHLQRLAQWGIRHVLIEDPRFDGIVPAEPIGEEAKARAFALYLEIAGRLRQGRKAERIPHRAVQGLIRSLADELEERRADSVSLILPLYREEEPAVQAINGAILAMIAARRSGFHNQWIDAGIGAFVRDLGTYLLPEAILTETGPFTREQRDMVRRHVELGLAVLEEDAPWSAFSKTVLFQHHERCDGSGYPRGLRGDEIHGLARLAAVADALAALVMERPYRKALTPQAAVEFISSAAGYEFDLKAVQTVLSVVRPYPIGAVVRLSGGEVGVVEGLRPGLNSRPLVRILTDAEGNEIEPWTCDLTDPRNQSQVILETLEY